MSEVLCVTLVMGKGREETGAWVGPYEFGRREGRRARPSALVLAAGSEGQRGGPPAFTPSGHERCHASVSRAPPGDSVGLCHGHRVSQPVSPGVWGGCQGQHGSKPGTCPGQPEGSKGAGSRPQRF